ncbi:GapS1 family protein [Vibrio vulnificus]
MSFEQEAYRIRRSIQRYTTESVVQHLLSRLHTDFGKGADQARSAPWVTCLALDWTLELEPESYATKASKEDVGRILNKIWSLQSVASNLDEAENIWLSLRAFLLPQLLFQQDQRLHLYFFTRLYTIMCSEGASASFKNNFKQEVGVELQDFFVFSLHFAAMFLEKSSSFISYSDLVCRLHPAFDIDAIRKMLKALGANPRGMRQIAQEQRAKRGELRAVEYFSEPMLISRPLLLLTNGVSSVHSYIATIGISEFVLRTLKRADAQGFKKKFGSAFEDYVAELLASYDKDVVREVMLKEFYQLKGISNNAKVADFLIQEGGKCIFVDAKAIEPNERILVTDSPRMVKDRLKGTIIHAIDQTGKCSEILEENRYAPLPEKKNRYSLIITHQDFYMGNAKKLAEYLGIEFENRVYEALHDQILIENSHFCCITSFESILDVCNQAGTQLSHFLDYCAEKDKQKATARFDMRQHINEYGKLHNVDRSNPLGSEKLISDFNELYEDLMDKIKSSQRHWSKGIAKVPEFLAKKAQIETLSNDV